VPHKRGCAVPQGGWLVMEEKHQQRLKSVFAVL